MQPDTAGILAAVLVVVMTGIHSATPVVLAGVGGSFASQVNVFNIALEGMMLSAAFAGFVTSDLTGSATLGILAGAVAGAVVSLLFAAATVTFRANEVVIGFTLNIIVLAMTAVLLTAVYGVSGSRLSTTAGLVMPIIGPIDIVTLIALASVVGAHMYLFHSKGGLRMRAIGGSAAAATAAGIDVPGYRYRALIIGGTLCGVGGAYLPLSGLSLFSVGMTAGIGFIAVAAVVFGDGKPVTVALACFVFGLASAAGIPLQRLGIPTEVVLAAPYTIALGAITAKAVVRRRRRKVLGHVILA